MLKEVLTIVPNQIEKGFYPSPCLILINYNFELHQELLDVSNFLDMTSPKNNMYKSGH